MNQFNLTNISKSGHLVDPPIIDFLAHDDVLQCYVAEFVPDPQVSDELKESVYLVDQTPAATRINELLAELARISGTDSPITQIAHAGGGDFQFYTAGGTLELHGSPSMQYTFDAYQILQVISREVQLEFILQQRRRDRAAV